LLAELFRTCVDKWTCEDEPQALQESGQHQHFGAFHDFVRRLQWCGNLSHYVLLVALRLLQLCRKRQPQGSQVFPLDTGNFCVLTTTCLMLAFKTLEDHQYRISTWEKFSGVHRSFLRRAETQVLHHVGWRVPLNLADLEPLTDELADPMCISSTRESVVRLCVQANSPQ
jgi:hypothetical protein